MKGLVHCLISSIALIGGATFGSFFIGSANGITTVVCIVLFGYSFAKFINANKDIEE